MDYKKTALIGVGTFLAGYALASYLKKPRTIHKDTTISKEDFESNQMSYLFEHIKARNIRKLWKNSL